MNQNGSTTMNLERGSGGRSTQVQSDWAETNTESVSYIKNKPSLATVATTGSYSDLSGTPSLSNVATSGNYDDLLNKPQMTTQTLTFVDENNVETNVVVYTQPTV